MPSRQARRRFAPSWLGRMLSRSSNSSRSDGTAAAQLYALCGIRLLDEKEFPEFSFRVAQRNDTVRTAHGCIVGMERVSDVVKQITEGKLDYPLKNRLGGATPRPRMTNQQE